MNKLSIIILGTLALVLIGMTVWQLMWMSEVVDNYGEAQSYKRSDPKMNHKENIMQDKAADAVITDHPADQELTIVQDRASYADSKEVTGISVKESEFIIDKPDSSIKDADRMKVEPSGHEQIAIREDEDTISIKLKSDKPLPLQRQMKTERPVLQRKSLDIPVPSVRQHATSTSPY